jgi:peptidoglycan/LPS O-acetylase OafA/YrhL
MPVQDQSLLAPISVRRIDTLQYLRAVAAASVVLYHASYYTNVFAADPSFLSVFSGGYGTFGVFVFFALSGHLMALQAGRMAAQPMMFMVHRLVRIYPIFWVICAIRIAVAFALHTGLIFDPLVLMLAPVGARDYLLGVEWTLVYEIAFYILVCAIVAVRMERTIGLIGIAWVTAIAIHTYVYGPYAPQFSTSLLALPVSDVCTAFAAGLTLPTLLSKGWIGPASLPVGVFIVTASLYPTFAAFSTILVGIGCASIVGWAASIMQGVNRSAVLGRLGDWSYATYLVHVPVLTTVGVLFAGTGRSGVWASMVALVLVVTPLFGMADITLHARLRHAANRWGWKIRACVLTIFAALFVTCMALSAEQHRQEATNFGPISAGAGPVIEDLEQVGWHRNERLSGHLESVMRIGGLTYFSGWVNNKQDLLNRTSMLLLLGDRSLVAVPASYRSDIIKVFGLAHALSPTAFKRAIPDTGCPPGLEIRAIVVSRPSKEYRVIDAGKCPT